jgi:hypothetical protein
MARGVRYPSVWMIIDLPSKGHPIDRVVFDPLEAALQELTSKSHQHIRQAHNWWRAADQPVWQFRSKRNSRVMERMMFTDSTPYLWVTGGTSVRFSVFGPGYVAATSPGIIGRTGPGGQPVGHSRRPKPGIAARNFEDVVVERIRPKMPAIIMKHVTGGLLGRFWGPQKHVRARIL